jgi:hypothetical protein
MLRSLAARAAELSRAALAVACLAATGCPRASPAAPAAPADAPAKTTKETWTPYGEGHGIKVSVEHALFEKPASPHFYVHVRVQNTTAGAWGVDLRGRTVVSPNQWGASDEPRRSAIDERVMSPPALDAKASARIGADFAAGRLAPIAAGGSLDYYAEFNASTRRDVDEQSRGHPYVLVSMQGWLDVSDGTIADRIARTGSDVVVDVPVAWAIVPPDALVAGGQ